MCIQMEEWLRCWPLGCEVTFNLSVPWVGQTRETHKHRHKTTRKGSWPKQLKRITSSESERSQEQLRSVQNIFCQWVWGSWYRKTRRADLHQAVGRGRDQSGPPERSCPAEGGAEAGAEVPYHLTDTQTWSPSVTSLRRRNSQRTEEENESVKWGEKEETPAETLQQLWTTGAQRL